MTKVISNIDTSPPYPVRQVPSSTALLLRNEGCRSLHITGDLVAKGPTSTPGFIVEVCIAACDGPVQVTLCNAAAQLDRPDGYPLTVGGDCDGARRL